MRRCEVPLAGRRARARGGVRAPGERGAGGTGGALRSGCRAELRIAGKGRGGRPSSPPKFTPLSFPPFTFRSRSPCSLFFCLCLLLTSYLYIRPTQSGTSRPPFFAFLLNEVSPTLGGASGPSLLGLPPSRHRIDRPSGRGSRDWRANRDSSHSHSLFALAPRPRSYRPATFAPSAQPSSTFALSNLAPRFAHRPGLRHPRHP